MYTVNYRKLQFKTENATEGKLDLSQEWDNVFPQSDKVGHSKVTFHNRYGITLAADLYIPRTGGRLPAIAMSGPYEAVKEQVSGLYPRLWRNEDSLPLLSSLRSPVKVAASLGVFHLQASIPKISAQR